MCLEILRDSEVSGGSLLLGEDYAVSTPSPGTASRLSYGEKSACQTHSYQMYPEHMENKNKTKDYSSDQKRFYSLN